MKVYLNRENLGTYVSITGFFTGLGLLIGSYIASRREEGKEVILNIEEFDMSPPKVEVESEPEQKKKKTAGKKKIKTDGQVKTQTSVEEEISALERDGWEITKIQRELVTSGLITIDGLKKQLEFYQDNEYFDYQKPVSVTDIQLPEVESDDELDWKIITDEETLNYIVPTRTYEYDANKGVWYRVMGLTGNAIVMKDMSTVVPKPELKRALDCLLFDGCSTVCVVQPDPEAFYFLKEMNIGINSPKPNSKPKKEPVEYLDEEE